jgi:hypothetical protein
MFMRQLLALATVVAVTSLSTAQQGQMPNFQAPPGYTTKVESVHKTYNFYGLTRNILIPWSRLPFPESNIPKGTSLAKAFSCPSKTAEKFYNDPKGVLPSFGTPNKQQFQSFKGKDGDGAILYMEYKNVLPKDAKEQLSKMFFKQAAPPDPNASKAIEQFLVNDHTVIIWCFKNVKSKVKELHQEQIFNLISEVATAMEQNKKK